MENILNFSLISLGIIVVAFLLGAILGPTGKSGRSNNTVHTNDSSNSDYNEQTEKHKKSKNVGDYFLDTFLDCFRGVATLVIGAFLSGNLQNFFLFALASIVCTGGVTLVIWIPSLIVIGKIEKSLQELILGIFKKNEKHF